jgi:MFS family permease
VAFGAVDLVMFLYPLVFVAVWPAAVCMVMVGLPGALMLAGGFTLLQRATADSHRGRVFGTLGAIEGAATVAGALTAGFLGQTVGIIPVLVTQGTGYLIAGLAVVAALRPGDADPASARSPQPVQVVTAVTVAEPVRGHRPAGSRTGRRACGRSG